MKHDENKTITPELTYIGDILITFIHNTCTSILKAYDIH